jgi:small subunit ribosomal protein S8
MTMTDPIADMLTRLRNANSAYHDSVGMPYSRIKENIAEILKQEGYISGWSVQDAEVGKDLVISLKYGRRRTTCRGCWAGWVSPSSPPRVG